MATKEKRKKKHNQVLKGPHGGMQLVLTENVANLGKQGDVVEVRPGYGATTLCLAASLRCQRRITFVCWSVSRFASRRLGRRGWPK